MPVHVGFQRRFDAGYIAARDAVGPGSWAGCTRCGPAPWTRRRRRRTTSPLGRHLPRLHIHDFDALRFVTGQEVVEVFAVGANRGAEFFAEYGDVDAAAVLLTLDDGTSRSSRRNPLQRRRVRRPDRGARLRDEHRRVGLDERTPLRSAEPGVTARPACPTRVPRPVRRRLRRGADGVRRGGARHAEPEPCTVADALEAFYVAEAVRASRAWRAGRSGSRRYADEGSTGSPARRSRGVSARCPGWGHQIGPDRVLAEMRGAGLAATEFGPDGFLPADPAERPTLLDAHDLRRGRRVRAGRAARRRARPGARAGPRSSTPSSADAGTLVLAADSGRDGYDERPELDDDGWATLLANLDRSRPRPPTAASPARLHPHVGTVVESRRRGRPGAGRQRRSPLCLDTGHLLIGGTDPVELARAATDRIAHVHLKDVDAALGRAGARR